MKLGRRYRKANKRITKKYYLKYTKPFNFLFKEIKSPWLRKMYNKALNERIQNLEDWLNNEIKKMEAKS